MSENKDERIDLNETDELRTENERLFRNNQDIREENRRLQEALKQAEQENRELSSAAREKKHPDTPAAVYRRQGVLSQRTVFILGMIFGVAAMFLLQKYVFKPVENPVENIAENVHETIDEVIDETFTGFTAADFQDVILGETSEHQELIVMEQSVSMTTTITKTGLGQFKIFSKMKDITFHANGVYSVDLSHIDADHIKVDDKTKTVTIAIPHASLQYVNADIEATEFSDTERGLLAFGDISLTAEQQNELEKSAYGALEEKLNSKEFIDQADEFAAMKTWELFQPVVTSVSPEYRVVILITDAYTSETEG